jgi:hypothetical protein
MRLSLPQPPAAQGRQTKETESCQHDRGWLRDRVLVHGAADRPASALGALMGCDGRGIQVNDDLRAVGGRSHGGAGKRDSRAQVIEDADLASLELGLI